jgi:hypothetical protein
MSKSTTQRSLRKLRDEGWTCAITEHWNQWAKVRQDLFGFGDILAFQGDVTMAVQTTSGAHVGNRMQKIMASPIAKLWCSAGLRTIVIHGWAKRGPRGARKVWTCREVTVLFNDENNHKAVPDGADGQSLPLFQDPA